MGSSRMRRRGIRMKEREGRSRRGHREIVRKASDTQLKNAEEDKDDHFILKLILKYSKYSWSTWLVMKIWIKLTTYFMLKARDMEAEAYNWISDWGPLVNPFINFIFWPVSRLVVLFYEQTEHFWNSVYFEHLLPIYLYHIQHLIEPPFFLLQDISVKLLTLTFSIYEALLCIDYWTLVFVVLFLFAVGETAS